MIHRKNPPIESLEKLLKTLHMPSEERTKTFAELIINSPSVFFVREHFDDGKGRSGAYSSADTSVTEEIFQQARSRGYIRGKRKPGYVSETEFIISDSGTHAHLENIRVAKKRLRRSQLRET